MDTKITIQKIPTIAGGYQFVVEGGENTYAFQNIEGAKIEAKRQKRNNQRVLKLKVEIVELPDYIIPADKQWIFNEIN